MSHFSDSGRGEIPGAEPMALKPRNFTPKSP